MTAVASLSDVQPGLGEHEATDRSSRADERSVPLCRTDEAFIAEHLRATLILFGIRAAVVQRDPLGMGLGVAEILVLAADHAKAKAILEGQRHDDWQTEWGCFNCGETVPGNFELCWNCCQPRFDDRGQLAH